MCCGGNDDTENGTGKEKSMIFPRLFFCALVGVGWLGFMSGLWDL